MFERMQEISPGLGRKRGIGFAVVRDLEIAPAPCPCSRGVGNGGPSASGAALFVVAALFGVGVMVSSIKHMGKKS